MALIQTLEGILAGRADNDQVPRQAPPPGPPSKTLPATVAPASGAMVRSQGASRATLAETAPAPAPRSWLVPALCIGGGLLILWLATTADDGKRLQGPGEPHKPLGKPPGKKRGLKDPLAYLDKELESVEEGG